MYVVLLAGEYVVGRWRGLEMFFLVGRMNNWTMIGNELGICGEMDGRKCRIFTYFLESVYWTC